MCDSNKITLILFSFYLGYGYNYSQGEFSNLKNERKPKVGLNIFTASLLAPEATLPQGLIGANCLISHAKYEVSVQDFSMWTNEVKKKSLMLFVNICFLSVWVFIFFLSTDRNTACAAMHCVSAPVSQRTQRLLLHTQHGAQSGQSQNITVDVFPPVSLQRIKHITVRCPKVCTLIREIKINTCM